MSTLSTKPRAGAHCSFCGRGGDDVTHLIAGPLSYICEGCIALAHSIVSEPDPMRDAAPDLYHALQALLLDSHADYALQAASAALKKARGE